MFFDDAIFGYTFHLVTHLLTFQPTYVEERGKLTIMKDYDERTIWTSDRLPLMTSYNKGL